VMFGLQGGSGTDVNGGCFVMWRLVLSC
jgi:hypothetical protein